MSIKTALIIPDVHYEYRDKRAYNLMLKVARDIDDTVGIDEIVFLGDYGEYENASKHKKHPASLIRKIKQSYNQINEGLDQIDGLFPKAKKRFLEGNHEYRIYTYVMDHPELDGILDIVTGLKFKERGYEFIRYGPNQKIQILGSKLFARHVPPGGGEYMAGNSLKRGKTSIIFGHTHQIQEIHQVDLEGNQHVGISGGWLGDKSHEIFSFTVNHNQWNLAFTIVKVFPNGNFLHQIIRIIDYTCIYGNDVYYG